MKAPSAALLAAFATWAVPAAASSVTVFSFSGPSQKNVRTHVVAALKKAGVEVDKGRAPPDPGSSREALVQAGKALHTDTFVTGRITTKKKRWKLTLVAHKSADGSVLDSIDLDSGWLPGLLRAVDNDAGTRLALWLEPVKLEEEPEEDAVARAPEPEPEPRRLGAVRSNADDSGQRDEDPVHDEGARSGRGPERAGASPLEIGAEGRAFTRHFDYDAAARQTLRAYDLGGAPSVRVAGAWYPGAHVTTGAGAAIGLAGSFEQSLATSSGRSAAESGSYSTAMRAYSVGVKGRIPLGKHEVSLRGEYGRHGFEIQDDRDPTLTGAQARDLLPDVEYEYLRPGIEGRLRFSGFELGAYAGYRHVLSLGDLGSSSWFPSATARGVDAGILGGYSVSGSLLIVLGVDLRRYGVDPHSVASDPTRPQAKAATDQYVTGFIGVEWRLPGAAAPTSTALGRSRTASGATF